MEISKTDIGEFKKDLDEIADKIFIYMALDKAGNLKKYYKEKYGKDSVIKMNTKRILLWMLIREGYIKADDDEMEMIMNRILWKRF